MNTWCGATHVLSEWLHSFGIIWIIFLARVGDRSVHKCEHLKCKSPVVCWVDHCIMLHVQQPCWVSVVWVGAATQK